MIQFKNLIVGLILLFSGLQAEELYATFTVEAKAECQSGLYKLRNGR